MSHRLLDQDKVQQFLASSRVSALQVDGRLGGGPLSLGVPCGLWHLLPFIPEL